MAISSAGEVKRVPSSRLSRLSMLGKLVGGIAGGVVSEGARQLAGGNRPALDSLLLSPANARRLTDRLSEMRGAAMKVGQLISMDSGHLLPPEFSDVLTRLREDAHRMPLGQVANALTSAWGQGWETGFKRFSFTPLAAASIGQVHQAELKDGRRLAIKIQYPGIRKSIDSDVDNVGALLKVFKLVPSGLDVEPLLEEAKLQLHREADYSQEAEALNRFARKLTDDDRFEVPNVVDSHTTQDVLSMTYLNGVPVDSLSEYMLSERNRVAAALLDLALTEVFDWGLVQTDPNFSNYLYQPETGKIQLLDFGAVREYSPERLASLHRLLAACLEGSETDIEKAAQTVGYLEDDNPKTYRAMVVGLLLLVTEPLRAPQGYTFGRPDLALRMKDRLIELRMHSEVGSLPPPDVLFLHRKLGGLYLLLTLLRVKLPVREIVESHLGVTNRDRDSLVV